MDLTYMNALPPQEFSQRRQQLFDQMQPDSVLLVFSAQEVKRNNDCTYPFRQDSYFWYLTGFNEPDSALLLVKTNNQQQAILFLRPNDELMEIWNGRRLGIEKAPSALNIDQAFEIEQLTSLCQQFFQNNTAIYYSAGIQPWGDQLFGKLIDQQNQNGGQLGKVLCWKPIVDEMRLIKSENEIRLMQQAGQISAFGHIKAMQQTRPNRFEYEIESEILHEFNRFGARFAAYNSIVAGGENACILHYCENDQVLKEGDLVLIDAGCEFAMYAGDITRTFPVNGKFSPAQRDIYQLVLKAQKRAIELLTVGNSIKQVNDEVVRIKVAGLVELGILQGEVEELINRNAHRQFYMHGLGHWLGLDVHDVGDYGENRDRPLELGMVVTVEPGIYISQKADVPAQYKGIGVRIEDNILITEYGNKILTAAAPKEIADIEQLMAD